MDLNENLYRAIKLSIPNQWDFGKNRPSSAAFKDSLGVSVDRQNKRLTTDVIQNLRDRFELRAIVSIGVHQVQCEELSAIWFPDPNEDGTNDSHALINSSCKKITLTSGQARKLSKMSILVSLHEPVTVK